MQKTLVNTGNPLIHVNKSSKLQHLKYGFIYGDEKDEGVLPTGEVMVNEVKENI